MAPVSKTDELNSLGSLILPSAAMTFPREYTEEEKQLWASGGLESLDPWTGRTFPGQAVYFYTDYENDDVRIPSWSYYDGDKYTSIWRDIAKKAFEIVEASL